MSKARKTRKTREPLSTLEQVRRNVLGEKVVIVDPGSDGTGWCLWDFDCLVDGEAPVPVEHGVLKSSKNSWHERMADISRQFCDETLATISCPDRMLLEWPELWAGSARSQASGASGDLIKLSALCGALEMAAIWRCAQVSLFISANEWKGQLTTTAVNARIKRANGKAYPNHASDAVGMGLAVMGLL